MEDNAKLLFRAPNSPFITSIINYQPKNRRHHTTTTHKDTTQQTTYDKHHSANTHHQTFHLTPPPKSPSFPPSLSFYPVCQ